MSENTPGVEMDESPTLGKLAGALAKAQGAIENAERGTLNANPHVNKKYADLGSVWDACRKPLAENELAVTQRVTTDGEEVTVTTMLLHSSGEFLRDRLTVRVAPIGTQPWIQALGISITYARRYSLSAVVGVAAASEDTDGEGATAEPATPRQRPGGPSAFPNFGEAKGAPISGAAPEVLEWYLGRARSSLADPAKAKWHAKESALIGAYEAELARQKAAAPGAKRETETAPTQKTPTIVDQQADESEEHAKMRAAGVFYAKAVKAGQNAGWAQADVGKWLREHRARGGKTEVTAADAEAFCQHLEPPAPEPGANG